MIDFNKTTAKIFHIEGKIFSSPYDWGGNTLIPQTLGFEPEEGVPYAEYWLGIHKKGPAQLTLPSGKTVSLDEIVENYAERILGENVNQTYHTLPYLVKLLDAKEMLSIQVHPNKKQAEEGYAWEERKGIELSNPNRTYKDDNHKPEYAVVLGDFWLLHGFRQPDSLRQVLEHTDELQSLLSYFDGDKYEKLYRYVMKDMSDDEANNLLSTLAQRIKRQYEQGELRKDNPDYWAAKAMQYMHMSDGNYDRGIFSIYFLNLVHMHKGQGIFQDAGLLHAYLEGPIIEVMANSDNVARGGITPKFVDIEELLKLVRFEGIDPKIVEPDDTQEEALFDCPSKEFKVSSLSLEAGKAFEGRSTSAEMLLAIDGNATVHADGVTLSLEKGMSVLVLADTDYSITGNESDSVYRICVPRQE